MCDSHQPLNGADSEPGVWPTPEQMPALRGLFVGGCVERGVGSRFRARAHAHSRGDFKGWVCFLSPKRVYMPDGRPSRILWHEYAHIISGHGHDDFWRTAMKSLGQPLPARYHKKKRTASETMHGCYSCGRAGGGLVVAKHSDGHWYCWEDRPRQQEEAE